MFTKCKQIFDSIEKCRSLRMVGDTVITGSDDWTARIWSVSRGTCDAVLACHAGPILCVEYSSLDRGIITGMYLQFFALLSFDYPYFVSS